ncbi:hypothetical protein KP509_15G075700 [Ceratopteris richardii]|uniref:RING-type E3 ubiquitin transferase n=1 Tax=Ceratopteris richardii TaxID=49495 RepID=A0A8T2T6A0_CERRI|nr:hypothetical protein KP509_15G075700 [Ceratopteris richardii]
MAMASSNTDLPQARSSDDDPSIFQNYSMNGKIIIASLGILFFVVFVVIVLHVYARWCWRSSVVRQRALSRLRSSISSFHETAKFSGLAREIVAALPIFAYETQRPSKVAVASSSTVSALCAAPSAKSMECAVCLSDFRRGETCKLLPSCGHFFHVECIDLWFLSQTTCPLCRATPGSPISERDAHSLSLITNAAAVEHDEEAQGTPLLRCGQAQRDAVFHPEEERIRSGDEHRLLHSDDPPRSKRWRRSISDKFPVVRQTMGVLSSSSHSSQKSPTESLSLAAIDIENPSRRQCLAAVSSCPSIPSLVSPLPHTCTAYVPFEKVSPASP